MSFVSLGPVRDVSTWLRWRRAGIGGSDAAVITGDDPFSTPMTLWLDKRGELPADDGEDEVLAWGKILEPAVIERFESTTGLYVAGRQLMIENEKRPWQRATVDGLLVDHQVEGTRIDYSDILGIYSGKTASRRAHEWADGPPLRVQIQAQHEMAVTGLDQVWVAALLTAPVIRMKVYEVFRDERAIAALTRMEAEFWRRVQEDDPPPAQAEDVEALRTAYTISNPEDSVELTPESRDALQRYVAAKAEESAAVERADQAKAEIMAELAERELGLVDGAVAVTWRGHERTSIDTKGLRARYPRAMEKWTRSKIERTFRVVGPKTTDEEEEHGKAEAVDVAR